MAADAAIAPRRSVPARQMVARVTAARTVRSGALWGLVFGGYIASSSLGYATAYPTQADRARLAAAFGSNFGFNAIIGPAHAIDTVAGFTAWRSLGVLSIVGAVWALLLATRLLRGEEEAGRWELLLAGQTTRRRAAAQALAGLGAGAVALWAVTAVLAVAVGRSAKVQFSTSGSVFLALSVVTSAVMFLAVGALASQLAATRRQAAAYAGGALGVAYALRMMADSGTGLDWMRWLSPLGWVEELRPLGGSRPLVLAAIAAFTAAVGAAAVALAGRRDLGASTLPDRSSARPHTRLLGGPTGLAVRLVRGTVLGWTAGIAALGLMMGVIAKSVGTALAQNSGAQRTLARLGGRGAGASAYLAVTFIIVALLICLIAAGQASAARADEAEGRLDNLLVRPVSRTRWLGGRIAVALGALVGAGLAAGLATWVGSASQNAGIGLGRLLEAGLNPVAAATLVLGIGVLTLGVWPRRVAAVSYGLLAWSFLVEIIGSIVNANHWLLDTSVLHHIAAAPAADPDWARNGVLVGLGALAALVGAALFARRDLAAE